MSSLNKQSPLQTTAFLTRFYLPRSFPLLFGGERVCEEKKQLKYLGCSSDDAVNTTLDH